MMNEAKRPQSLKPDWARLKVVAVLAAVIAVASLYGAFPASTARAKTRNVHYQVVPVIDGAVIDGVVRLEGTPPEAPSFLVSKDQHVCGHKISDPSAAVGIDGEVQWAFVYLEGVTQGKRLSAKPVQINNKGCTYVPYVQGGVVGARIEVVNSDDTLHNVHSYLGRCTLWNLGLPLKGLKVPKRPRLGRA